MPQAKFIVLTSSRTGSTWMIDLLNMQTGVEAHGELFLDRARTRGAIAGREDYPRFVELHGNPRLTRVPRVFSYLNGLYESPHAVGFKLMYSQLRAHPEILAYLPIRRVRVVHLTRRNHIDVIISEELARLTGASHAQAGSHSETPMVRLDPTKLIAHISRLRKKSEQARQLIRLTTCRNLEVNYEALLADEQELVRILDFLGLSGPAIQVPSNLAKRGKESHQDAIVNYHEIRRTLASTPYSGMLR